MSRWWKFLIDDDGPTAVEYGILLGLIVVTSVNTLGGFGTGIFNIYTIINGALP
jgi:Flp pilus assembly pilin Flp